MKGLDVFIVRFLPFILFSLIGVNSVCLISGIDVTITYKLHSNSALYSLGLLLISLANKKYHCIWNRAMYLYLICLPIFNFLDEAFNFIPNKELSVLIANILWLATALITAYLAIRHFVNASKRRMNSQLPREIKARRLKED